LISASDDVFLAVVVALELAGAAIGLIILTPPTRGLDTGVRLRIGATTGDFVFKL
jgi:ABC-type uncharacterized transport system ATPase subunit